MVAIDDPIDDLDQNSTQPYPGFPVQGDGVPFPVLPGASGIGLRAHSTQPLSGFLAFSPAAAQPSANPGTPHFLADLPLLDCDGTPCVGVKIGDDEPIRLSVDSADVDSVLDATGGEAGQAAARTRSPCARHGLNDGCRAAPRSLAQANLPFAKMDVEELTTANQLPHSAGPLA
jgi:hypothetical protein